jgi:hypothetical protein
MLGSRSEERLAALACNDNWSGGVIAMRRNRAGQAITRTGILRVAAEFGGWISADFMALGVFRISRH